MLKKLGLHFIPENYRKTEDSYQKARLLINSCLIAAVFSLLYGAISAVINFKAGVYAMLINIVLFSTIPFFFKKGWSLIRSSNLFAAIGTISIYIVIFYSGGFRSQVLPWLASTPIMVLLLAGKKSGWIWAILSVCATILLGSLDICKFHFPVTYNQEWEQSFTISTYTGLVLIVFVIALVFENGKNTALHKLQLRTLEVEEKNKDITDSINYAKRIQYAILPPNEKIKTMFPESFVLFLPKDIVSGDFYWCGQWGPHVLIAAVDCTGHGVPGAFLSIVGSNLLNQNVNELGLTKPSVILNSLNKGLSKIIHQNNKKDAVKDGMDISLCSINYQTKKLEYAGAYNPLWLIRDMKFIEIKADKVPIGASFDNNVHTFTNHEIDLLPGDTFYLFSDGFADQFGGHDGKKFKYKQLQNLLLSIQSNTLEEQKEILHEKIDAWKGNLEQVDDILLLGVRI